MEPAGLRWLRRLVTVLTLTMILGILAVVGLLAARLTRPPPPDFPETLAVPAGERITTVSRSADWVVVVTETAEGRQRLHLLTPGAGRIHQSVDIRPAQE